MLQPTLTDAVIQTPGGVVLSQETHVVSTTSPYHVVLDQIPKVIASANTPNDNLWSTLNEAAALMTVERYTGSNWTAMTLTASSTPASGEVFPLVAQANTPYAPVLKFHSAQAGATVRISYTGLGSAPMAAHAMRLWRIVQSLNAAGFPRLFDLATYHDGYFDGAGANDKGLYVAPSSGLSTPTTDGFATFAGGVVDLSTLSAFSNANYWRRVSLSATPSTSGWTITKTQSTDAATPETLPAPECPFGDTLLGWVDVQNTGTTGQVGAIQPVTAARLTTATYRPIEQAWSAAFSVYGGLLDDTEGMLVLPQIPANVTAQATLFVVMLGDQPSGSTTVTLTRCSTAEGVNPVDVDTLTFYTVTAPFRKTATILEDVDATVYFRVKITTTGNATHLTGYLHGFSRA